MHVSIDGQKLIRAYVYFYVLSCKLKINFLVLSYLGSFLLIIIILYIEHNTDQNDTDILQR